MSKVFVPYAGDSPVALDVKGHRLLFVASSKDDMIADLSTIGGDTIREVEDGEEELLDLAVTVEGGVVMSPPGVRLADVIESLEEQLPWIH